MEENRELSQLEKEYGIILDQIDIFEKLKENLKKQIILKFETAVGHQGHTYTNPETGNILQRVIQVRTSADSDAVKKAITLEQWEMVKKETVDMERFTAAIKMSIIDPVVVNGAIKTSEVDTLRWRRGK